MSAKIIITFAVVLATVGTLNAIDVYVDPELCTDICPDNYLPVCGFDGEFYKEFPNECELRAHNCQTLHAPMKAYVETDIDMCRTELVKGLDNLMVKLGNLSMDKPECRRPCPKIYMPLCISNGKYRAMAANQCIMDIVNCAVGSQGLNAFKVIARNTC